MLRITFLLLILANVAYYLWSHERLARWGLAPVSQAEPQRLQQQIRPDALSLLPQSPELAQPGEPTVPAAPDVAAPEEEEIVASDSSTTLAPAPQPEPTQCLLLAEIGEREGAALLSSLQAHIAADQWEMNEARKPGRWMVYMGRFDDNAQLEQARTNLRARRVDFARADGALAPGFSLGRFSTEQAAQSYLNTLRAQGVQASRVVQERPDITFYTLRLPAATPTLRAQVQALAAPLFAQRPLAPC